MAWREYVTAYQNINVMLPENVRKMWTSVVPATNHTRVQNATNKRSDGDQFFSLRRRWY